MDQIRGSDPAAVSASVPKPLLSRAPVLIAIAAIVLILVGIAAVLVWGLHLSSGMSMNESSGSPILGTWQRIDTSTTSAKTYNESIPFLNGDYIGFAVVDGAPVMRQYNGDDSTSSISEIDQWTLTTTNGTSTLNQYSYGSSITASTTQPLASYIVRFSGNNMTIQSTDGPSAKPVEYVRVRSAQQEQQLDFLRTGAQTAQACSDILNGTGNGPQVLLPISCPFSIGGNAGQAVLSIDATDTVRIVQNGRLIFYSPNEQYGGEDAANATSSNNLDVGIGPFLIAGFGLAFDDVTYDGDKDIAILVSAGAYDFTYDYYAYDPGTGAYSSDAILTATNPQIDPKARTITSDSLGRGLGDIYDAQTYQFGNGKYTLVREETQDTVDPSGDTSSGYIHKVWVLQRGKMVLTQQTKLSASQGSNIIP